MSASEEYEQVKRVSNESGMEALSMRMRAEKDQSREALAQAAPSIEV